MAPCGPGDEAPANADAVQSLSHLDSTVVQQRDLSHDGEPESAAGRLDAGAAVEAVEDALSFFAGDSGTVVTYLEDDAPVLMPWS